MRHTETHQSVHSIHSLLYGFVFLTELFFSSRTMDYLIDNKWPRYQSMCGACIFLIFGPVVEVNRIFFKWRMHQCNKLWVFLYQDQKSKMDLKTLCIGKYRQISKLASNSSEKRLNFQRMNRRRHAFSQIFSFSIVEILLNICSPSKQDDAFDANKMREQNRI